MMSRTCLLTCPTQTAPAPRTLTVGIGAFSEPLRHWSSGGQGSVSICVSTCLAFPCLLEGPSLCPGRRPFPQALRNAGHRTHQVPRSALRTGPDARFLLVHGSGHSLLRHKQDSGMRLGSPESREHAGQPGTGRSWQPPGAGTQPSTGWTPPRRPLGMRARLSWP